MKQSLHQILHSRVARWSLLFAIATIVAATVAWSNGREHHLRLEGAWVGNLPGLTQFSYTMTPLDPEARSAALKLQYFGWGPDLAALLGQFGGQTYSEAVGEVQIIGKNLGKYTMVYYYLTQANPPEVKAIVVQSGFWRFTGPMSAETFNTTHAIYLPTTDADADGLPDAGATPAFVLPDPTPHAHHRVPILPPLAP
jgi:hypothetical protein